MSPVDYKYDESKYIDELKEYIDSTYTSHYQTNGIQIAELIYSINHGTGFNIGNILKYASRYGKKGSDQKAREDLIKILHYTILQLYLHDKKGTDE